MTKPVFICAHRCNKTKWVDDAVNKGFNAIETDIWKNWEGEIWARHDKCAPGTKIDDFLNYVQWNIFNSGNSKSDNIVMWIWDLKDPMTTDDISKLRKKINEALPSNVYKFYCITDDNRDKLESIISSFDNFEGINYDANYFHENTPIENVLSWKKNNNVENLIYSCGIDPLATVLIKEDEIIKGLRRAVRIRNKGNEYFGIYAWTFSSLDSSKRWLESLLLNGVMGNTDESFGALPQNLPQNLSLATRINGTKAWRNVETNPNLNVIGFSFEMNDQQSKGDWNKSRKIGNQNGTKKIIADGYCWNSDINYRGYGQSSVYLGDTGPFYSIIGGCTEYDGGEVERWGKRNSEKFLLSHGYQNNSLYSFYYYVYLVTDDQVDNINEFEVTLSSNDSWVYSVGDSNSDDDENKWGSLLAWDSASNSEVKRNFNVYTNRYVETDHKYLEEDKVQLQEAWIQVLE